MADSLDEAKAVFRGGAAASANGREERARYARLEPFSEVAAPRANSVDTFAVGYEFTQRKIPFDFGGDKVRTAGCWSTAHEHRRVVIMRQSDCVSQFMRDDVARNIWQCQRPQTIIFDSDQRLVATASSKRNKITFR